MIMIITRVLGAATIAGITAATPALADDPGNTIGNNMGALLIASQNEGANAGNDGTTSSHGSSNGNTLANNIADQSNVALINTAKVAEDALVTA
ncbi:hypothetical protein ACFWHQ_38515 [Streptomyces sp. NPDC060334]|uniref:hypothetical protein n=1 Tax=Streptomyces sp. NPDC060334 TaxID=3347099 RepID=UPI00366492B5